MDVLVLTLVVLAAATVSGAVGIGGGTILVAAMAWMLPPAHVVPLHGVLQTLSNSSRGLLLWRHVQWRLIALYVPLQLVGVVAATLVYRGTTLEWFRPAIGAFVLAAVAWDLVRPARLEVPRVVFALAGFGGGLLTILVGVTGPYLAAFFLRDDLEKEQVVATKAAIQTIGHCAKIPAFVALGFDYGEHLALLAPLTAAAIAGTWVGTRLLERLPQTWFRRGFRVVLVALGSRLLLDAVL